MEDSSLFMQWAMDTLQHENPAASVAGVAADHGDFSEATFPSLKALREASQAAEMVQELIADADVVVRHALNSWNSGDGGGDTTANYNVPAGWNFGGATSTQQPGRNGMTEAPALATRGLPPPDLVYGPPPITRRAGLKSLGSMAASYAQDHIIAERKRREKINQRFIELSTVIPGLKKMDKATILLDATRYLKELQEKLKDAEAGRSTETLVLVKKPCLHAAAAQDDGHGSSLPPAPPAGTPTARKRLPEIEVRFSESEKSVVVRVHCEKRKGVVVNVLTVAEELHLSSIHANVMPFTACTCIITIAGKVEESFTVTTEEIVGRLNSALLLHAAPA
ncbi:transcription factor bHLH18-like [Miscanthus floridulus]|uniref:transcription factor bHLH18-like n=1 Tax=Miscanthus floridulus TaxID=154761 RepID=UPI003457A85B